MKELAPIALFVYNRVDHAQKTVEALKNNELATESILYVFSDGPKPDASEIQRKNISDVKKYIYTIKGFKDVVIEDSERNKGLANSIIGGVSKVLEKYGRIIVLEDDLVTNKFFLRYMNDCLNVYMENKSIYMIGGYNYNFRIPKSYKEDVYVVHRGCSTGWATWRDRWIGADWSMSDYKEFVTNEEAITRFNRGGNDMTPMLKLQMEGKIDSWAIRWDYYMSKQDAYCLHPTKSLLYNVGWDGTGIHSDARDESFYRSELYQNKQYDFKLPLTVIADPIIEERFKRFYGGYREISFMQKVKNCLKYRTGLILKLISN